MAILICVKEKQAVPPFNKYVLTSAGPKISEGMHTVPGISWASGAHGTQHGL